MKDYISNFSPRFVGLTGSPDDIAKVASAYRVYYAKIKGKGGDADYLMDHSTILYLMGPDGKYVTHFNYGAGIDALVADLREAIR
jgi:protein SCO1/2